MLKTVKNILKKNKDVSFLFNELKKVKGNKNYLAYILNFRQHILNPKEDVEEKIYDIVNYLRNSKEVISNIVEKKIRNGSVVLHDNSPLIKEILHNLKYKKKKKMEMYNIKSDRIYHADIILVGKNVNSAIFKTAEQYNVPIFLCINSLKPGKINNNFTGVISELGIYKPHIFEEVR